MKEWGKWLGIGALAICLCGGMLAISDNMTGEVVRIGARALMILGSVLLLIWAATRRPGRRSPAYSEFGKQSLVENGTGVNFGCVAADAEAKRSLMGMVDYLRNPRRYAALGARMPRGVLLYGPPGTGKTLLARALAGEAGVPFFALSGSDFVQMYVGVGAGRVRELFAGARKAGRCVIFIDEIDALGRRRSDAVSEERDQTLNALLSEMSGFRADEGILVVAATNRPEALDSALLRPGRFDRQIQVGLPGREERLDILRLHSRNKPMGEDVDLNRLAAETCSFSGASLEALLNEAAILAAERNAERIGQQDIDRAFYRTVAGEDASRSVEPEEKLAIAAHEAGHAVALKALTPESRLKRVSILAASRGMAGYNLSIPKERTVLTQKEMEAQIGVLLAGRAAEVLLGGEKALTSGAAGDLRSAAELMGSMVLDLGMGGEPAVASRAVAAACGGGNSQEQAICRQKLDEIYERVIGLLTGRMDRLTAVTQALLEREVLDGGEVEALMGEQA